MALVGCIDKFTCNTGIKFPEEGYVLAPWVRVTIRRAGVTISVGNKSSPENNHTACIKEFEYGYGDGFEARIVIHDEQGSNFVQFMYDLIKDIVCMTPTQITADVEFGWVKSNCPGGTPVKKSPKYYMSLDNITGNFVNGKFLFEVTARDLYIHAAETRIDHVFGSDDNKIHLTDAITQMFTDPQWPPSVGGVEFLRYVDHKTVEPILFKHYDGDKRKGPKSVWRCNNLSKMDAALSWLSEWVTDKEKSIIPTYDNTVPTNKIIFWEDRKPNCGEGLSWEDSCIGTYIVNGGKSSPVIEFTPKVRWDFMSLSSSSGNAGDVKPFPFKEGKEPGIKGCNTLSREGSPSAGVKKVASISETSRNKLGKESMEESMRAQSKQMKALKLHHDIIEADLVIIGDPTLIQPSLGMWTRNVAIVFINPFHILPTGGNGCGEWLIVPPACNAVLSNKAWIVKSINHRITAGTFTTTLGVYLVAPGIDVEVYEPLGGLGSGGWTPVGCR
jgi:hypothetical protein